MDSFEWNKIAGAVLGTLIFILVIFGVLLGGTATWLRQARWHWAARRAENENRELRLQLDRLQREPSGMAPPRLSPPLQGSSSTLRSPAAE